MERVISAKEENKTNKALYIMKTFAVISIVLAHTYYDAIANEYIKSFLSIYKNLGVYIFFILSGYFFNINKYKNIIDLLKDKFIKICIPWITVTTMSKMIVYVFNKNKISFLEYFNYLLGNGSYLYYLTVLIIIYIIIYFLSKKSKSIFLYVLIGINIISVVLTNLNVFPQIVNDKLIVFSYLNPYLNIMNWIGIFSIGMLLRNYNLLEKYKERVENSIYIITLIYLIICVFICLCKINYNYWNILSMIMGIAGFIELFAVSLKLTKYNILMDIGKKSFFIYLIHLLFLGVIFNSIFKESTIFAILRPIITVSTIYIIVIIGEKIAKILKLQKIYEIILGVR